MDNVIFVQMRGCEGVESRVVASGLIQVDSPQGLAGILKGFPLIHLELGFQDGYQNYFSKLGKMEQNRNQN